jgi:hypothetical protein
MAYLYYLPFCMLFTSGDNLHRRTAPLFLRRDQSFAEAAAFKAALKKLDDYYTRLPDEIKELGAMAFAHYPPTELDNLVVDPWDNHMRPDWRDAAETPEQVLERWQAMQEEGRAAEFRSRVEAAQPVADGEGNLRMGNPTTSSSASTCRCANGNGALSPRRPRTLAKGTGRSETPFSANVVSTSERKASPCPLENNR